VRWNCDKLQGICHILNDNKISKSFIQVKILKCAMVIGEITSSQQDIMFVQVRVEDAAFIETNNGTVKATITLTIRSARNSQQLAGWEG